MFKSLILKNVQKFTSPQSKDIKEKPMNLKRITAVVVSAASVLGISNTANAKSAAEFLG